VSCWAHAATTPLFSYSPENDISAYVNVITMIINT